MKLGESVFSARIIMHMPNMRIISIIMPVFTGAQRMDPSPFLGIFFIISPKHYFVKEK